MSPTNFTELFDLVKSKFPPAQSSDDATIELSTDEFISTFLEFSGNLEIPTGTFLKVATEKGYRFEPIERNGKIVFVWLIAEVSRQA